jgi:hypothetical protein
LVPEPDSPARDYLILALRLGKVMPGLVDAYFGPQDLKAQVDAESPLSAVQLRNEVATLLARLPDEVAEPDRRRWLGAQLVALEAQTLALAGDPLPYADFVACCFDIRPERTPDAVFAAASDDISRALPPDETGASTVTGRLAAWEARFKIEPGRLPAVCEWLVERLRDRSDRLFGLPTGENAEIAYVSDRPWTALARYQGGRRTRVEFNVDRISRPAELIRVVCLELYPGRHTERAWKERRLVDDMGRLEHGVLLLSTPEALLGEGLASLGERIVAPDDAYPDLLMEMYERAGLAIIADPVAAREAADREVRIRRAKTILRAVPANAAFLLHADGAPREEVAEYLRRFLLTTPERADDRLALIEDPIHRASVITDYEGERLLHRWFELGPSSEQYDRFGRLLREATTPSSIDAELPSFGRGGW